ncbi:MAG: ATP-binding protein [Acidimicrobiia bacterium]
MRRRIVALTTAVAALAVLVLGVPLAVLGRHEARADASARVDREVDAIAFALAATLDRRDPVTVEALAPFARDDRSVVVRDANGNTVRAGRRLDGAVITARVFRSDGARITLRVDAGQAGDRAKEITLAVAIFGLLAVAAAAGTGWLLARRVTAPLDELAQASARLGAGGFSVSVPRHGISETDAVADALETSAARIDALVQSEREFSANASHQLRSPLTALRMRLEELADTDDADAARTEAEAALEQADRLDETITELLALARQGRIGDAVDVDVARLVDERVEAWQPAFARAHRAIRIETAPRPGPVEVRAHPGGVGQALDAVIDNALRHGAGTVTITLAPRAVDVEVVVADEGPGLTPEVAATAFERHVSQSGGTGVGLALARTLAAADGGRVDALPGAPTRVRLRLPLAPTG